MCDSVSSSSASCRAIADVADPDPISAGNWCEEEVSPGKTVGSNTVFQNKNEYAPEKAIDGDVGTVFISKRGFGYWWIDLLKNWNIKSVSKCLPSKFTD